MASRPFNGTRRNLSSSSADQSPLGGRLVVERDESFRDSLISREHVLQDNFNISTRLRIDRARLSFGGFFNAE
jgi:hypothetical protein